MSTINKDMTIGEVLSLDRGTAVIFMQNGMHCVGCPSSSMETIEEAGMVHGLHVDTLLQQLNDFFTAKEEK